MPYIEGPSLRDKLTKEGELPIGEAVRILRDVVDALTESHAHGVVSSGHQDREYPAPRLRGGFTLPIGNRCYYKLDSKRTDMDSDRLI